MQRQMDLPGTAPADEQVDPFADHQARMSPTPTIRRLCTLEFLCHLCQELHAMGHYITLPAESLDEYAKNLVETFSEAEHAVKLLQSSARTWHTLADDLQERLAELGQRDKAIMAAITAITIGTEEYYTCDACHAEFPSIGLRRLHLGRDPVSNMPAGDSECPAPQGHESKASTE